MSQKILYPKTPVRRYLASPGPAKARRSVVQATLERPKISTRAAGGGQVAAGYAAVFYDGTDATQYELWGGCYERIMPTAFASALKRPDDVLALFNHNTELMLGRTASGTCRLSVDKIGLRYEIDLPDTSAGRDVAALLARGDVVGSSFAFVPTSVTWRREPSGPDGAMNEVREINDLMLFDVGPVATPAYPGTAAGLVAPDDESLEGGEDAGEGERTKAKPPCNQGGVGMPAAVAVALARVREIEMELVA